MKQRYICIHGHFYQPPRENPWLEYVEMQDSAYPYHDWNERVTAEAYAPNTAARILDGEGYITRMVNNYARMSFDFGPTLLYWLEKNSTEVYEAVISADRESQRLFSGHGAALAQAYNHLIMPLANRRDKRTQVLWGIRDFEHRFGRKPEGMWLPETAVDMETMDIMAENGILFTILAPHQAGRVRRMGNEKWTELTNADIDPSMPYRINLTSGRQFNIFFYNGSIAQCAAFGDLLKNGESFACRLVEAFSEESAAPQLSHIANDGETYGHHHRFGEMALAYATSYIESKGLARITSYGEFLEKHPPTYEVEVRENTSWSCPHGVERWRSDCGCNTGRNESWNQSWRTPLRQAMDWLRDTLASKFEEQASRLLKDPWAARDDYIQVVLNRSPDSIQEFLTRHALRQADDSDRIAILKLMELQRHAMLMFTSDGWYFDELYGIETLQVIQNAGRAAQLAGELFGDDIEHRFLKRLGLAKSNIPAQGDGRRIYERYIKPAMASLTGVAAHLAISSLFGGEQDRVYCYSIDREDYQTLATDRAKLSVGRARITSGITTESSVFNLGAVHLGGHIVYGGVREYQGEEAYKTMVREMSGAFSAAEFRRLIKLLETHLGTFSYSLKDLFHDRQRQVMDGILESALAEIEIAYHHVYEHFYPPMRFLTELGNPVPRAFYQAAEFILNNNLHRALGTDTLDLERVKALLDEAVTWKVELDAEGLAYLFQRSLERILAKLDATPSDLRLLDNLIATAGMVKILPFGVDLWRVQNLYNRMMQTVYPGFRQKAERGDQSSAEWVSHFSALGQKLSVRIP